MKSLRLFTAVLLCSVILLSQFYVVALACATCGCSELCPVTMFDEAVHQSDGQSLLSNSIWGNMILKLAYERDPELQKLRRYRGDVRNSSATILAGAAAGTLGQNITSMYTLNPPNGMPDSYAPGIAGLALEGMTNIVLLGRIGLNAGLHKKIQARQRAIRQRAESILQHLEYSETSCPEAQKDLAELIGDKAAAECLRGWNSVHAVATVPGATTN